MQKSIVLRRRAKWWSILVWNLNWDNRNVEEEAQWSQDINIIGIVIYIVKQHIRCKE